MELAVLLLYIAFLALTWLWIVRKNQKAPSSGMPPVVKYKYPYLGSAIEYSHDAVSFLERAKKTYGDTFTVLIFGRRLTYVLGAEGSNMAFNVKLSQARAEDAYSTLTTPVFGRSVVYDVDNSILMQQKKFIKDSFTSQALDSHVKTITMEYHMMFDSIASGGPQVLETFNVVSDLIIYTASHCLLGSAVRQRMNSDIYRLYRSLDLGLQPINLFVKWLPLPNFINRDRAQKKMSKLFHEIIQARRRSSDNDQQSDIVQTLMNASYGNGKKMTDEEIAHLMIAILLAGQHTSSATATWFLLEVAARPHIAKILREELSSVLTGSPSTPMSELPEFTRQELDKCIYLDCVLKEVLRHHPPIHSIMRAIIEDIEYKGYTIPKGNYLCTSIALNSTDPENFSDSKAFLPERFMNNKLYESGEWKFEQDNDVGQNKIKKHVYLPFGDGRHRCIGEKFAYVQIKTLCLNLIKNFNLELPKDPNGDPIMPLPDCTSLTVVPSAPAALVFTPLANA